MIRNMQQITIAVEYSCEVDVIALNILLHMLDHFIGSYL